MPLSFNPQDKEQDQPSFHELYVNLLKIFYQHVALEARGNRPLQMSTEHQLKALIFITLRSILPGRHLLQVLPKRRLCSQEIIEHQTV